MYSYLSLLSCNPLIYATFCSKIKMKKLKISIISRPPLQTTISLKRTQKTTLETLITTIYSINNVLSTSNFFHRSSKFSLVTYSLFQYSSFSPNFTCTLFRHLIQIIVPPIRIVRIPIFHWMINVCFQIFCTTFLISSL